MFKPSSKLKRILSDYKTNVMIFKDGVIIREERMVKVSKQQETMVQISHYVKCDVSLRGHIYTDPDTYAMAVSPIEMIRTRGSMAYYGINAITVFFLERSEAAKRLGIAQNRYQFRTADDVALYDTHFIGITTGESKAYPDPTDSHQSGYHYKSAEDYYNDRRHSEKFVVYDLDCKEIQP